MIALDDVQPAGSLHDSCAARRRSELGAAIVVALVSLAHQFEVMVVERDFHGTRQRGDQRTWVGACFEESFEIRWRQHVWGALRFSVNIFGTNATEMGWLCVLGFMERVEQK